MYFYTVYTVSYNKATPHFMLIFIPANLKIISPNVINVLFFGSSKKN